MRSKLSDKYKDKTCLPHSHSEYSLEFPNSYMTHDTTIDWMQKIWESSYLLSHTLKRCAKMENNALVTIFFFFWKLLFFILKASIIFNKIIIFTLTCNKCVVIFRWIHESFLSGSHFNTATTCRCNHINNLWGLQSLKKKIKKYWQ